MAKEMRKVRTGTVVRTKMDKTAVVESVWKQRHRLYRKQMRRVARYNVHDPLRQCQLGDVVQIQEVRPISKTKRWRLLEIIERRQVAEVRAIDLEADAKILPAEDSSLVEDEKSEDDRELNDLLSDEEDDEEDPGTEDGDEDPEPEERD